MSERAQLWPHAACLAVTLSPQYEPAAPLWSYVRVNFTNPDLRRRSASCGSGSSADEFLPTLRRALDLDTLSLIQVPCGRSHAPGTGPARSGRRQLMG
jgi:hypothetical protein